MKFIEWNPYEIVCIAFWNLFHVIDEGMTIPLSILVLTINFKFNEKWIFQKSISMRKIFNLILYEFEWFMYTVNDKSWLHVNRFNIE